MRFWRLCEKRNFSLSAFLCGFWLAAGFGAQMVEAHAEDNSIMSDGLAAEAKANEDAGRFKACGTLFAAAADSGPRHLYHAQRLFNAGRCFRNAGLVGKMIESLEALINRHPKDSLVQQALIQVASGYAHLASYSEAAKSYEEFVQLYPGEGHAVSALRKAIRFRMELGELDKALDDMRTFVKYYASRRPMEAAEVDFQMSEIYEQQENVDEVVNHLKAYLVKWGSRGGVDRQILAHFKLGEIAWNKSCPQQGVNGTCVSVEASPTGRTRNRDSASPGYAQLTVHDRASKLAKAGQDHFKEVLKLWNEDEQALRQRWGLSPAQTPNRDPSQRFPAAGAAFYQAEQAFEQYLKVTVPQGLNLKQPTPFDTRQEAARNRRKFKESERKLQAYLVEKSKLVDALAGPSRDKMGLYDLVLFRNVDYWPVAALARIGQVFEDAASQFSAVEEDRRVKLFESESVAAFRTCLYAAEGLSLLNAWSTLCDTELNRRRPRENPLPVELMPEPRFLPFPITPAALIPTLTDDVDVASR